MSSKDLPDTWSRATLNDLVDDRSDIVDGPFGSNLKSAHYVDHGARVIRLQNIGFGNFVPADAFITLEHYESLARHNVLEGDLLFASLGENLPRTCLAPRFDEPCIVKADCIRVRLAGDVNPKFVLHATQRPDARKWAEEALHGMGRPRLGLGAIREFPVPLPPVDEQHRIVQVLEEQLSHLDAVLASIKAAREKATQFRRSVLHAAVTGALLGQRESIPGHLPPGWDRRPLGSIATFIRNGVFVSRAALSPPGEAILRISAVRPMHLDLNDLRYAHPEPPRATEYRLSEGDLLFTRYSGTRDFVGACAVVPSSAEGLLHPDKLIRVVLDRRLAEPAYVVAFASSPEGRRWLESVMRTTAGQTGIAGRDLQNFPIVLPPIETQRQILKVLDVQLSHLDAALASAAQLERHCAALRRSLLHAAFTGKLTEDWRETARV